MAPLPIPPQRQIINPNSTAYQSTNFAARDPSGGEQVAAYSELNITGPGRSIGNPVNTPWGNGWTVGKHREDVTNVASRGIHQVNSSFAKKRAVGDFAWLYAYFSFDGGSPSASDEGPAFLTIEGGEHYGPFEGVVAAAPVAGDGVVAAAKRLPAAITAALHPLASGMRVATFKAALASPLMPRGGSPTLAHTAGNPWTTDGAFLLNLNPANAVAGRLNGPSQPVAGTHLNALPVTGVTLPLSTAWGTCSFAPAQQAVGTTRDARTPVTVTVTLSPIAGVLQPFVVGEVIQVAGDWYVEQTPVLAASTPVAGQQALTLGLSMPNSKAVLFQGGLAGYFLVSDSNWEILNVRSSYHVFGSVDGATMIYGVAYRGSVGHIALPMSGVEAMRCVDTPAQPWAGVHLYPGAEVVGNSDQGFACTLEPNRVVWAVGDPVGGPHHTALVFSGVRFGAGLYTPAIPGAGSGMLTVAYNGSHCSSEFAPFTIANNNPFDLYAPFGGPLAAPTACTLRGFHDVYIRAFQAPAPGRAMFEIMNPSGDGKFDLVNVNYAPNGHLSFDAKTATWGLHGVEIANLQLDQNPAPAPAALTPTHTAEITVGGKTFLLCLVAKEA